MRVDNTETCGLPAMVVAEIRAEMARQRVTQTALADRLGWTQTSVWRRLTGEVAFDLAELERIAEVLGVPVSKFLPAGTPAGAA